MKSTLTRIVFATVAALALGVGASASASAALPEFLPGAGNSFTGAGGPSFFETTGNTSLPLCNGLVSKASLTGTKAGTVEVELKGCHTSGGFNSVTCQTAGKPAGIIVFTGTIEPVYLSREPKNVGVLVNVNEFTAHCSISTARVRGSFLGSISPINKLVGATEHFTFVAKQAGGVNEFTAYENSSGERKYASLLESFEGGTWVPAGYESTEQLTPRVQTELKA
jgi:hypothetical protein